MRAAIFKEKGRVEAVDLPDQKIKESTDAVVRVTSACVCGSDLWFYRGVNDKPKDSTIGHEFMGIVESVGDSVANVAVGDFVIAPFTYSDGTCPHCKAGMTANCTHGGGWSGETGGGQGEMMRVPQADGTLVKIPKSDYSRDMQASLLTLSDVMCTGHHAAVLAGVKKGDTVAVVGDGAVGLCAVIAAKRLGASRIIALSRHEDRQMLAREFGATDIVPERGDDAVKKILEMTDGVGVDAALECVGTDESVKTAIGISRPGSVVGSVGLPTEVELPFKEMFFKNIGIRGGVAPARAYIPELLEDVLSGAINPGKVFTLSTDLENIQEAYAAMDERRAIKTLLNISEVS